MLHADAREPRGFLFHPGLISIGTTLIVAAFVSDVIYWQTLLFQWNNFSEWLLAAGLVFAGLAAVAVVVDRFRGTLGNIAWLRFGGLTVAALVSLVNAFVHSRDSYTAVVPDGILLSAVATAVLVAAGIGGWSLEVRRRTVPRTTASPRNHEAHP